MQEGMDDFDLPDLLADGAPAAGPEVLGRIVRRHDRRRIRRARIAASTAVVVALAAPASGSASPGSPHQTLTTADR